MKTHRVIPIAIAIVALCGIAMMPLGGCGGKDKTETSPDSAVSVCTKVAREGQSESPEFSLESLAARTARFVEGEISEHRTRYEGAGLLAPERVALEISHHPGGDGSARQVLLARVESAVTAALAKVDGIDLGERSDTAKGDDAVLRLAVTGDLTAPTDKFHILAELALGDRKVRHRDGLRLGLVTITASSKEVESGFVVRAIRGDFASEFKIAGNRYFTLPIGKYDTLLVRAESDSNLTWSPPASTVLLANVWPFGSAPPVAVVRRPLPVLRPPVMPSPTETATGGRPGLTILAPSGPSARHVTVWGTASNLDGAIVYVVVHPAGDIDYIQDGRAVVGDSKWRIPRVILGRPTDSGKSFSIRAETVRNGRVISSPPVSVVRR